MCKTQVSDICHHHGYISTLIRYIMTLVFYKFNYEALQIMVVAFVQLHVLSDYRTNFIVKACGSLPQSQFRDASITRTLPQAFTSLHARTVWRITVTRLQPGTRRFPSLTLTCWFPIISYYSAVRNCRFIHKNS